MQRLLALFLCLLCLPVLAAGAEAPVVPSSDRGAVTASGNAFAVDLYDHLKGQGGNLFFSPESLSTALAMAYAGARGDTASAMAKALRFTLPPDRLHPAMGALLSDLNAPHASYQLSVANALWTQRGAAFLPGFVKIMNGDYGAGFEQLDFKTATEAARITINHWVEQKTAEKIKDLLPPGILKPTTRLVLTNAIYFKGNWQTPFDKAQTREEDFHASPGSVIKSPLMHRSGSFPYFDGGSFQALEIPYKNNELSMVILLPKDEDGLAALEQSLSSNLQPWLQQLAPVPKVMVTVPKFKMTRELALGRTLGAMGMAQAFSGEADFSGMTGARDFAISEVVHKAYVDVNEEGTEAAAATAVTLRAMAMRAPDPTPPPVFRADHPFVFLIRDLRSNSILFLGRLSNPAT